MQPPVGTRILSAIVPDSDSRVALAPAQLDNLPHNTFFVDYAAHASERASLERQWLSGGEVSTEDDRQVLRRYRSFFGRLLSP